MKIGIMQPYFFPYVGYWQLIRAVDKYIIYDDVNYIKRGWINRNRILYKGDSRFINIHIKNASQNRLIKDTQIAQNQIDTEKLLLLIKEAYKKAPYFNQTYNIIQDILYYKDIYLVGYLKYQIEILCKYFDINTEILLSSEIKKNNTLKGEEKILEICKIQEASTYINAYGGINLYHKENFEKEKIDLKFLKMGNIQYKQFENQFISGLSIIDVMMFNSVEEIKEMLLVYELQDVTSIL